MASPVNAVLCALIATAFWTLTGYALARKLLPRAVAMGAAGVVGWAAHSAVALPVFLWIGLTPISVVATGLLCVLAAGFSLSLPAIEETNDPPLNVGILVVAAAAAMLLALAPAAAILPKIHGDAAQLSDPIFDHSKIAMVDAIARLGLPPVNPVFGAAAGPNTLAYYYLWHFSAAELELTLDISGWEADVGLTFFTALASLWLMMGLAIWFAKRTSAATWVVVLATAGSLWPLLYWFAGSEDLHPVLGWPIGLAGWLFQASWVPQHVTAAGCVVTAMLLLARVTRDQSPTLILTLALLIVAGFESSTFVGGVTFAIAALVAAPLLFAAAPPARRLYVAAALALAAALVVCLIAPFVLNQLAALRARGVGGSPIVISPYSVFGDFLPPLLRRLLDLPGYWLIILPIELPAAFIGGGIALVAALRRAGVTRGEKTALRLLACLAGTGLVVPWLLVSTLGDNNDLGLRAIIPAIMVLIVAAASAAANMQRKGIYAVAAIAALSGLVLSLPDTARLMHEYVAGQPRPGAGDFAQSPELWAAVRRYAPRAARVANNPLFVKDVTPWPVNISWALLANRSSCFAGVELAIALAPLSAEQRATINAQFVRVFAGQATPEDVHDLAARYGCDAAVVVRSDQAWDADPFAASPDFRLEETQPDRWRIYVRR